MFDKYAVIPQENFKQYAPIHLMEEFQKKTANYPHFVDKGGGVLKCG